MSTLSRPVSLNMRNLLDLLGSMRFAISLLTVISIASVIGTVLKQNEPYNNYLNQFGQFWFVVFEKLGLYAVYNTWWFLGILAFLVLSTSLCLTRNTPKMLSDMRRFKEHIREGAFAAFTHRAEMATQSPQAAANIQKSLEDAGYKTRVVDGESGVLIAAKRGTANRLGYVFAHAGIVVVCVGGLLDSDLLIRAQLAFGDKRIISGNPALREVPPQSRLEASNPSFRGNVLIAEGGSRDVAVLNHGDGILLQELPFSIQLKKFIIEHYSTGQPKLFASDVVVTDRETGKIHEARIEVNKPFIHRGIAVYQSSFDDGGTRLALAGYPLAGARDYKFDLRGEVGGTTRLTTGESASSVSDDKALTLEFTGFRPFNVERFGEPNTEEGAQRSLSTKLKEGLGAGAAPGRDKVFRNVGPSFSYKLRDAAGQAREFTSYMLPLEFEKRWYLMSGVREDPNESFRYLRVPIDGQGSLDGFMRLRAAVLDPATRAQAGKLFAARMTGGGIDEKLKDQLADSARRALETFSVRGLQSVSEFLEKSVPEAEREKAAEVFLKILNNAAWEAWGIANQRAGIKPAEPTPENLRFVQDSLNAISDSFFYGAPVLLRLDSFDEIKASVFQLTRSPGKNIVYLGSLLLTLGVFAMLYIRERRAWALVKRDGRVLFAMTGPRKGVDLDQEFGEMSDTLRRAV